MAKSLCMADVASNVPLNSGKLPIYSWKVGAFARPVDGYVFAFLEFIVFV